MSYDSILYFFWLIFDLPHGAIWANFIDAIIQGIVAFIVVRIMHSRSVSRLNDKFEEHQQLMTNYMQQRLTEHRERIEDLFDPETPGGITHVIDELKKKG